ncbi:glycosyltransferase family 2 protein [Ectothiorhodospira marina]|uniref:Glycosyltransferase involved in cell wall bisynthesis n=1 Tax=Ectothiorhodospira marina TaxID=1396821 RepID=A0A1H7RI05_9GAMM|nr:glycosyltransferase family 2 protein [Ectothiorhodospira marina]SEL59822.1 Glycosyltransferase involved in cell wall bisynthesis [Ectothiorhodospira marina]
MQAASSIAHPCAPDETSSNSENSPILLSIIIPVLNNASQANHTIKKLTAEPPSKPVEIIIVDDGSNPPIQINTESTENSQLKLLRLKKNQGRAGALNTGIRSASGLYMTFLDVDCVPETGYMKNIQHNILSGTLILFGDIHFFSGDPFFDRYGNRVQARRRTKLDKWTISLTSANVTLHRDLVLAVNGFDPAYRHYGFEDRDFFLRLAQSFPNLTPMYKTDCSVKHVDVICLRKILKKFETSGCHTARIFQSKHPDAYRKMPMYYFDTQANPIYRYIPYWILSTANQGLSTTLRGLFFLGYKLNLDWLAIPALKGMNGLAFMRGTLAKDASNV